MPEAPRAGSSVVAQPRRTPARRAPRTAPYGKTDATALTNRNRHALRAIERLVDEVDRSAATDPVTAARLADQMLSVLLGPRGRALLPHVSRTVSRLLAQRSPS
jgi:hypothetical protein